MTDEDKIRAEMWAYATVYRILRYALIVLHTTGAWDPIDEVSPI